MFLFGLGGRGSQLFSFDSVLLLGTGRQLGPKAIDKGVRDISLLKVFLKKFQSVKCTFENGTYYGINARKALLENQFHAWFYAV